MDDLEMRDFFAALVLHALISSGADNHSHYLVAARAYLYADAMMEAREEGPQ